MTNQEALVLLYKLARMAPVNGDAHDAGKNAAVQLEKALNEAEKAKLDVIPADESLR